VTFIIDHSLRAAWPRRGRPGGSRGNVKKRAWSLHPQSGKRRINLHGPAMLAVIVPTFAGRRRAAAGLASAIMRIRDGA